jgi:hypothetical protein
VPHHSKPRAIVSETRRQRQMRLLREIARLRRQMQSCRAKTMDLIGDSRRVCIESRYLVTVSDDYLDLIHAKRHRVQRQRA